MVDKLQHSYFNEADIPENLKSLYVASHDGTQFRFVGMAEEAGSVEKLESALAAERETSKK